MYGTELPPSAEPLALPPAEPLTLPPPAEPLALSPAEPLALSPAEPLAPAWAAREPLRLPAPRSPRAEAARQSLDCVLALLLLILTSPLLVMLAALVALEGRPVLFAQPRLGREGRVFACYKFRTMVPNAEARLQAVLQADHALAAEWQRSHKLQQDPRVTRSGRWLRRWSLDELPQLFNVLRGDMALVGPRPIVAAELCRYGRAARCYLQVRPGLTGLWQVSGRCDNDYRRRVAMDVIYARTRSLRLDLLILLLTVRAVLARRGAY